jgi:hypothetical protein
VEHDFSLLEQARRSSADASLLDLACQTNALVRRTRRRARLDALAVAAFALGAVFLGSTAHEALLAGSAALSLGILGYVIRRDRDLVALAGQVRWREEAVKGRGVSMREWHQGAKLEPWGVRRTARAVQPDGPAPRAEIPTRAQPVDKLR